MANMSYCRFENTLNDMRDCIHAMNEADNITDLDLNSYELQAFQSMAQAAQEISEEIQRLLQGGEAEYQQGE